MTTPTTTLPNSEPLFTRDGAPYTGAVSVDEAGRPYTWVRPRCGRCGGAGRLEQWRRTGLTCFDCEGSGVKAARAAGLYTAARLATLNASAAKRAATAAARRQVRADAAIVAAAATAAAVEAAYAPLFARCAAVGAHPTITDIVEKARLRGRLSEPQVAFLERLCAEAEAKAASPSAWVGTVGQRLVVSVTVRAVAGYERGVYMGFGATESVHIVTMADAAGNQIVSKSPRWTAEVGETFTVRATVKAHDVYRDERQTQITRVVRVDPDAPTTKSRKAAGVAAGEGVAP